MVGGGGVHAKIRSFLKNVFLNWCKDCHVSHQRNEKVAEMDKC